MVQHRRATCVNHVIAQQKKLFMYKKKYFHVFVVVHNNNKSDLVCDDTQHVGMRNQLDWREVGMQGEGLVGMYGYEREEERKDWLTAVLRGFWYVDK